MRKQEEKKALQAYIPYQSEAFILFEQANLKNYEEKIRRMFSEEGTKRVLALYPASADAEARRNWADIYSAFYFTYGHAAWARQAARIPFYEYLFIRKNNFVYFSPFVLYSCMRPCYPFITVIDRSPE